MHLSTTVAIQVADEIATAVTMPYEYHWQWQAWRDTDKIRPAWNRHEVVRAAVSLARVPEPRH